MCKSSRGMNTLAMHILLNKYTLGPSHLDFHIFPNNTGTLEGGRKARKKGSWRIYASVLENTDSSGWKHEVSGRRAAPTLSSLSIFSLPFLFFQV